MDIIIKSNGFGSLYIQASGRLDLDNAVDYGMRVKDTIEDSEETISEVAENHPEWKIDSEIGVGQIGQTRQSVDPYAEARAKKEQEANDLFRINK